MGREGSVGLFGQGEKISRKWSNQEESCHRESYYQDLVNIRHTGQEPQSKPFHGGVNMAKAEKRPLGRFAFANTFLEPELREFQAVATELEARRCSVHRLRNTCSTTVGTARSSYTWTGQRARWHNLEGGNDSGFSDYEYTDSSQASSPTYKKEKHSRKHGPRAYLGDTRELEAFIAYLDKTLADM
uniref:regulator of cell cycle RGCC n=1 Tax=Myxine glutinosa TaxID=7769 RepID=UPI00358E75E2